MSCSAFWRTASAGGFRVTTPFIYPCLSPLKCHQDIVLWILINCGWLQEASAELRGLTSEFPGVAAAGAAWCHMEPHAAPPPHKLHIRCCVLFSHSTFMLFSSPAPVVQISISALYVPCRYLSTYLCQTYLSELGVEKSWNATRPHQTSAKAKKSTCKKNEINTHTSPVTVFSKRSVLQNQDLVLLPEIVMQAVISPRRGWPLPCCT